MNMIVLVISQKASAPPPPGNQGNKPLVCKPRQNAIRTHTGLMQAQSFNVAFYGIVNKYK